MDLSTKAVFDPTEALSIVDGDKELFIELVNMFRENYPAELAAVRDAIGLGDAEALRRAAHHLKGTLSALAANPARDAAFRLEETGRGGDLSQARNFYTELEYHVRTLDQALAEWV